MSIHSRFDADEGVLFIRAEGLLKFDDILIHLDQVTRGRTITRPTLLDAREAQTDMTSEQTLHLVQRVMDMRCADAFGPTAVITTDDFVFSIAATLSLFAEMRNGPEVRAFRTVSEGLDWLVGRKLNTGKVSAPKTWSE